MSVSATKGANIYRIQRDNDLIRMMLDILSCVQKEYRSIAQAQRFEELLWGRMSTKYRNFLMKIRSSGKRLSKKIAFIPHEEIQRGGTIMDPLLL